MSDPYDATQQGTPVRKIDRGQQQPDGSVRPLPPPPSRGQVQPSGKPGEGEVVRPVERE
jgi:hypothetical protein